MLITRESHIHTLLQSAAQRGYSKKKVNKHIPMSSQWVTTKNTTSIQFKDFIENRFQLFA